MPKINAKGALDAAMSNLWKTVDAAKAPTSVEGKKINRTEAKAIHKAIDDVFDKAWAASNGKAIDPQTLFEAIPGQVGLGLMQTLHRRDFKNESDFRKLWNRAVDSAASDPNVVQALVD